MIQMYDHQDASIVINEENWFRQGQTSATSLAQHQNPEYFTEPRWWTDETNVEKALNVFPHEALLAFKNVTSPTNQRTMIASFIPKYGVINSAPLILFNDFVKERSQCCFLANINSFCYDYIVRQKIGNVNLNYFLLEQIPMFSPDYYDQKCPWDKKQNLEKWISERVLKLTCTSNDLLPLAKATGFKEGVHKWKVTDRLRLMAELDAAFFLMYRIERIDVLYILSTFSGIVNKKDNTFVDDSARLILEDYDSFKKAI